MKFAFQKMQLEAPSFIKLINTWAEMQLVVTETTAAIVGDGYAHEILEGFTLLVFDWEATIPLPRHELDIPAGSYDMYGEGSTIYAGRGDQSFQFADRPVTVEVVSVPEE